jgi:hypothetical protein
MNVARTSCTTEAIRLKRRYRKAIPMATSRITEFNMPPPVVLAVCVKGRFIFFP